MGITSLIAAGGAQPNIAGSISTAFKEKRQREEQARQVSRQETQDIRGEEDRQLNREAKELDIKAANIDLLDDRKKRQFDSISEFTSSLEPTLNTAIESGDTSAVESSLVRRLGKLQDDKDAGLDVNLDETTEALAMVRAGDLEGLSQIVSETNRVSDFRRAKSASGRDLTAGQKNFNQLRNLRAVVSGSQTPEEKESAQASVNDFINILKTREKGFTETAGGVTELAEGVAETTEELAGAKEKGKKAAAVLVEKRDKMPKARFALRQIEDTTVFLESTIDETVRLIQENSAAGRVVFKDLPLSDQKTITENLATIRANVGFDKLQSMRDASPTGGALGQVSELENRLLQATSGSLDQNQKTDILIARLTGIKDNRSKVLNNQRKLFSEDFADVLGEELEDTGEAETISLDDFLGEE